MNKLVVIGCCLLFLSGCSKQLIIKKKVSVTPPCSRPKCIHYDRGHPLPAPPISIWVHGTKFIRHPLYYSFFGGRPGFQKAKELDKSYHLRQVVDILSSASPQTFSLETFYLFGWSGKLHEQEREDAARAFYTGLQRIIAEYQQKYGEAPFIRVLCHSHGGNVVLNMAKVKHEFARPITINELILFACPVQNCTMHCVDDNLFEHVYSFYSSLDLIQIIAPQIVYKTSKKKNGKTRIAIRIPPLSDQRFPFNQKVTQIKIKMNSRSLLHGEFTIPPFISSLPQIMTIVNEWKEEFSSEDATHLLCVYTKKPSHPNTS